MIKMSALFIVHNKVLQTKYIFNKIKVFHKQSDHNAKKLSKVLILLVFFCTQEWAGKPDGMAISGAHPGWHEHLLCHCQLPNASSCSKKSTYG